MERPRPTAADRAREEQEAARRRGKLSLRLGGLGVAVLFLGGLGVYLLPDASLPFIGAMVVGILLVVVALVLVWGSPMRLRLDDQTKIY
ncbi:MAG TPA: hypothetical protein VEY12_04340 [Thermoplasmata archaeon]|nr:hypothetical protein [Thermoplasmata archaeon]